MPINNDDYRVKAINQTNDAEKFHRDRRTKRLVKELKNDKNIHLHNNKSFAEILNEEMAKKK